MSASFVVDCSVTMTWLFTDQAAPATTELLERLAGESALVPGLWFLEVTNVLAVAERHARITSAQAAEFLVELSKLEFEVDDESPQRAFDHLLPLCRAHQLTSYDAAYLDLAVHRGLPLATLDEPLRQAAGTIGVELLGR